MSWLTNNKDVVGIGLALIGLLVTAYTVRLARSAQRRDGFMRIHEALLAPDVQEGRRLLFGIGSLDDVPAGDSREHQLINRSLAMYDTLGYYVRQHHIDRRAALDVWHHSLREVTSPARVFCDARKSARGSGSHPFPDLEWLLAEASSYRARRDCCTAATPTASPTIGSVPNKRTHD
ncbi:hypothetical protein [Kribbella sp. NPDC049227]|uniref:hypothetical protein n=1 Tax=Kribbella sp. NPDC049227 TaxID=3364113 RepID=UPI0037115242